MATLPFDVLFRDNGAAKGLSDIAKKTAEAGSATDKLAASQAKLAASERKLADAAGAVRLAELKLQGVRNNSKATAAQRLAAEERLASVQRRLVGAQREVAVSSQRVAAAHRQVAASAEDAGKKTERSTSRLRVLGKVGGSSLKVVGVGAAAAVGGVGLLAGGLGALVKVGIDVASQNEQAAISFTTMLGSARRAQAFLGKLKDFAAKTPFEFPELQRAASSLISVGINAKQVIPIMTTLGNVTSGMGTGSEGVQRATIALQQMSAAGRITAEDLNQLRDAGIPLNMVFKAISERTGQSSKKLLELYQNGKLGRKELEALMASLASGKGFERFNGLMDKQSKSLAGMISTLKDSFSQGLAGALEAAMPFVKGAIGRITTVVTKFFNWLQTHQGDMVDIIGGFGEAVLTLGESFTTMAQTALTALSSLGSVWDNLNMFQQANLKKIGIDGSAFSALGKAAGDAANAIGGTASTLKEAHAAWTKFVAGAHQSAALRDAAQGVSNAFDHAEASVKRNGKTLDDNTKKGHANRAALKGLASAGKAYVNELAAQHASTKRVNSATESARSSFIKAAVAMGATKKQAKELATQYGLLPKKKETKVSAPGATQAKREADAVRRAIGTIPGQKNIYIHAYWTGSRAVAQARQAAGRGLTASAYGGLATTHGILRRAGGGSVPGYSPHSRADNIPAMLTAGEYVQPVSSVRKYGEGAMSAIREGRVPASALRGYASGGPVDGGWSRGGGDGGTTYILNAPNYVGSTNDLRRALVDMARRGELEVIRR